jgi:hypothetical protein
LRFERLEDRLLLTIGEFEIQLYEDADGAPGDRITNDTVDVGDRFFVEILVRENDPRVTGFRRVALDIHWDPAAFEEIDTHFDPNSLITPNLPVFQTGTLDNETGSFMNLGGAAFPERGVGHPIGSDGNDRFVKPVMRGLSTTDDHFAWLQFRALQPVDDSLITMRQGASRILTMPLAVFSNSDFDFERQSITVRAASESPEGEVEQEVWETEAPDLVLEELPSTTEGEPVPSVLPDNATAEQTEIAVEQPSDDGNDDRVMVDADAPTVDTVPGPAETAPNAVDAEAPPEADKTSTSDTAEDTVGPKSEADSSKPETVLNPVSDRVSPHLLDVDPFHIQLWYVGPQPPQALTTRIVSIRVAEDTSEGETNAPPESDSQASSARLMGPIPWPAAVDAFFAQADETEKLLLAFPLKKRSCPVSTHSLDETPLL